MTAPNTSQDNGRQPASGQLRFFQGTTLVLALLLIGGLGYFYYRQHALAPVTVQVDGKPITTVDSMVTAKQVLHAVHAAALGDQYFVRDNPRFTEQVDFVDAPGQAVIDSADAAETKLSAATHTVVDADVIIVNKKKIVALPDAQTAQAAVDELRQHYATMPPDIQPIEKPTFVQTVSIERMTVPASLAKNSADDAASVLWTPPPPKTVTVLPHETGWAIARKYNLQFSDFLRANAGHNVNRLAPGDTVVISKTFPPVDVVVIKQEQKQETFGGTGVRELTVQETYIDGVLTGTPVATSMVTIKRATPHGTIE